jgi:hypothetical protein
MTESWETDTTELDTAAARIMAAKDLEDLRASLCEFEELFNYTEFPSAHGHSAACGRLRWTYGIDITDLPKFGGEAPTDTDKDRERETRATVWSWDEDRLLVGAGAFSEWSIVPRKEW